MIGFVPALDIFSFENAERLQLNLTFFRYSSSHFFLSVQCLLFQGLHLKTYVFAGLFEIYWLICSLHCKPDSPRMPKCCYQWQNPMFRLIFVHKHRLEFFHDKKVAVEKTLLLRVISFKNLFFPFLHCNVDGPQLPNLFVIWTLLDFRTHVSPKQLTSFPVSRSQSKTFDLFWIFSLKIIDFIWCSEILMDQKCKNVLLLLTYLEIQTYISFLLYLLCLSIKESIDSFFTWGGLFVFKYHENCSLHRIWGPDRP